MDEKDRGRRERKRMMYGMEMDEKERGERERMRE